MKENLENTGKQCDETFANPKQKMLIEAAVDCKAETKENKLMYLEAINFMGGEANYKNNFIVDKTSADIAGVQNVVELRVENTRENSQDCHTKLKDYEKSVVESKSSKLTQSTNKMLKKHSYNPEAPLKILVRVKPKDREFKISKTTIEVANKNKNTEFKFDRVFSPRSTTNEIYREIKHLVEEALLTGNRNFSVLAYGQTGSGKTYTMMGNSSTQGLLGLLSADILSGKLANVPVTDEPSAVQISVIEIYNEKTIDLLDNKEKNLVTVGNSVFLQSMESKTCNDMSEMNCILHEAMRNRKTGDTALNKSSSRSHLVIKLAFSGCSFSLVDLAGSENNKKSGNSGVRMEESLNINRSLFVLHKVVNSIVSGEKRIPYRDSKLTRLLQDSIGGSSCSFLIATIIDSYENMGEAINTLNFASKSSKIVNRIEKTGCDTAFIFSQMSKSAIKKNIQESTGATKTKEIHAADKDPNEMTPMTKKKSYLCFLNRAQALEASNQFKKALEEYKTLEKISGTKQAQEKIKELREKLRKTKNTMTKEKALEILNSGDFIEIKKIGGVGDKRAQSIVEFIKNGKVFSDLEELRSIFSENIYMQIVKNIRG
ncbi:kinesin family member 22 [Enteropsectra breve]|nr:kinesin family member 22 [Enteropsectra breve]